MYSCSGLWIDTERSWLVSSPDGLVFDGSELGGIVVIKCQFQPGKWVQFKQPKCSHLFLVLQQKKNCSWKNHDYFYQVQGQLAITHAKWCDYCVCRPHGFPSEHTTFDDSFWKGFVSKLDDFYFKFVVQCTIFFAHHCTIYSWFSRRDRGFAQLSRSNRVRLTYTAIRLTCTANAYG